MNQIRHRGRTASYPTAPSHPPPCGIAAPGSLKLFTYVLCTKLNRSFSICYKRAAPITFNGAVPCFRRAHSLPVAYMIPCVRFVWVVQRYVYPPQSRNTQYGWLGKPYPTMLSFLGISNSWSVNTAKKQTE
jgi:hypothetical protein